VLADEAVLAVRIDSVVCPPWGTDGGKSGGIGRAVVNPGRPDERLLRPLSDGNKLKKGDILRLETGGGGGRGHPFDRPAGEVLRDVQDGFVSVDAAARQYGVVIREGALDEAATVITRASRPATRAFHRTEYVDALV